MSDEAVRDAEKLARRISPVDYETLKMHWQKKNYYLIAFMLRMYGLEFKGLTHLEMLMEELNKIKEHKDET